MAAVPDDDILDDLFLGCALVAYLDQAAAEHCWPDSEATRCRAYRYYEDAIAEKTPRLDSGGSIDVSSGVAVD
jgi:hypothetical protein